MKAQCAQRVIQKYPGLIVAPDWRMWISSENLEQICDKASLSLTVEDVGRRLTRWKWGMEELKFLWRSLLRVREAIRDVQTTAQIQERLPDWPWHHVGVSELKKAIKEDNGDDQDLCGEGVKHTSKGARTSQKLQSKQQSDRAKDSQSRQTHR